VEDTYFDEVVLDAKIINPEGTIINATFTLGNEVDNIRCSVKSKDSLSKEDVILVMENAIHYCRLLFKDIPVVFSLE
jgi:hypothetical protein